MKRSRRGEGAKRNRRGGHGVLDLPPNQPHCKCQQRLALRASSPKHTLSRAPRWALRCRCALNARTLVEYACALANDALRARARTAATTQRTKPSAAGRVAKRRARAPWCRDSRLTCGCNARCYARARARVSTRNDAPRRVPGRRSQLDVCAFHSRSPHAPYRARIGAKLSVNTRMHNAVILRRCASPCVPYS